MILLSCCYLHSGFAEVEAQREFLPREHVGVLRLVKGTLQLVQLVRRECSAAAAHLLRPHTPQIHYSILLGTDLPVCQALLKGCNYPILRN